MEIQSLFLTSARFTDQKMRNASSNEVWKEQGWT